MNSERSLKYFLYARKSTESEDRQVNSIDDQIKEVNKIAERLELNIVAIFKESKSAKAPGRKIFNEMLDRIEKGEADAILCWKLNRLARNPLDGGKISWLLQNNIIKHIQCYDRDYKPTDNVLTMQVDLGIGNQFVIDLSGDVIRGMRDKAQRGWYPYGTLPIGYLHNKDNKGVVDKEEIVEDKARFTIVKKLWRLMLTGSYSIADIKREGDKLHLRNSKGKPYCIHTYHKLFSNEFYYGYFYWKDENGVRQRYKGLHKPMVREQDFDRVQVHIGNHKRPTRKKKYEYQFRGLLKCGECGCSITAERKFQVRCTGCRHKFSCINRNDCPKCGRTISEMINPTIVDIVYYRCTKRKGNCSQKSIPEPELESQYANALNEIEIDQSCYEFLVSELERVDIEENSNELKVMRQMKKRISELENRINGLAIMKAEGDLSKEQYRQMKTTALDEITDIEKKISEFRNGQINWLTVAKKYLKLALNASNILKETDISRKKSLLFQLGSNQTLMDKKLTFIRAKPLLAIKQCVPAYKSKNDRFEPKNPLVKQGDSNGFDTANVSVCPRLHDVRTSIMSSANDIQYINLA